MPTGPKHYRVHDVGSASEWTEECRCMIGEDHDDDDDPTAMSDYLSPDVAEDIWLSSGKDEDYDFR